ncbi:type II and III secretion system protein family protein [Erythrobacter mangrovi]|uniref:Type II and III secretion system protein family protein n=1 Tax=Erythrobacter mangrovi TaxID=2739433 RepID=A0A7D4B888_9SPHN|nr:type II and III secretion system protein family protein [Erythrobacter mangrovi]QKG70181.1 type II and III secretion system protein family protein [Erythrobacter mangrovi]
MNRRLSTKVLLASLAFAPLISIPANVATAQSVARPANDLVLSIGRGELVTVPGTMADVFVADDSIADVQVKSQRQLYVFGKAGGETTVYASNAAGDIVWSTNVRVGSNIDSIDQMLALAMPAAKVAVSTMGTNTVLLTGTVAAPEDASEAQRLVEAFVGEDTNVISRLKMATPLQVNLQVRFAEVSRTLVRDIGSNLTTVDSTGGFKFGVGTGRGAFSQVTPSGIDPTTGQRFPAGPVAVGTNYEGDGFTIVDQVNRGSTIAGFGRFLGLDLLGALDLGEQVGLVTTLSEPNLTALSGETAEFLAGGEFPIPQSQGLGTTSVEYKKYGVSLTYTPTVLSNGRISIRVRPEVSELSTRGAVIVNGFQIPALTTRRAETTIELGSGQSFMIAGLMQNSSQNQLQKTPGLGDVPILGNLFRSKSYQKGETELVIVVTPYLVKPVNANDIVLPTDGFRAPNEIQSIIGYMENNGKSGEQRPSPTMRESTEPPTPGLSQAQPVGQANVATGPAQPRRAEADVDTDAKPGFSFE